MPNPPKPPITPVMPTISNRKFKSTISSLNKSEELVAVELITPNAGDKVEDFVTAPLDWLKANGHKPSPFLTETKLVAVYRYGRDRDQVFHLSERPDGQMTFKNRPSIHGFLTSQGTGAFVPDVVDVSVFLAPVNSGGSIVGNAFIHAHVKHTGRGEKTDLGEFIINPLTFLTKVAASTAYVHVYDPNDEFPGQEKAEIKLNIPAFSDLIVNVRYREKGTTYRDFLNRYLYDMGIDVSTISSDDIDNFVTNFLDYYHKEIDFMDNISRADLISRVRIPAPPSCVTIQGDIKWVNGHWELNNAIVWAEDWVG